MSQTLLEMAKDLVIEQVRVHNLSPDDAESLLLSTHATLRSLHQAEEPPDVSSSEPGAEVPRRDWKNSISKYAVICLECGETFRQLSARHLRTHGLDPRSYRRKYGIPASQPLSSRQATARRRELARQIRPWEGVTSKRTATKK